MDLQSLFFVLLVIAIGGFSAYLADILGYKIGKKRLSIKRIRPKYVARISVVIAGMLIPIITMLLLYAVSSTFRTWITRGSQVVQDLEQKTQELSAQDKALKDAKKLQANLENERQIVDADMKSKKADLEAQKKTLAELKVSLTALKTEVTNAKAKADKANKDREVALAKLGPIENKLKDKQREFDEADKRYKEAEQKYQAADAKYKDTVKQYGEISNKNLELNNTNLTLQKANDELAKASDALKITVSNLTRDLELLKSQKTTAESDTIKAKADLQKAQDDLIAARTAMTALERGVENFYRGQPISYLRGQELTRISIPANVSQAEATTIYRSMLRRAKSVASDHGAQADPDAPFTGSAGSQLVGPRNIYMTEGEVESYWVDQMRQRKIESVMISRAAMNQFGTEAVILDVVIKPNPIVFHKSEIVTEMRIDGRTSEIEVLNVIREFLRTYVNTKARSRNMIPVQGRDGESYGEFSQDQLLAAVSKVKAVTRNARLVAVARQDIRAGDPLDIDLDVR